MTPAAAQQVLHRDGRALSARLRAAHRDRRARSRRRRSIRRSAHAALPSERGAGRLLLMTHRRRRAPRLGRRALRSPALVIGVLRRRAGDRRGGDRRDASAPPAFRCAACPPRSASCGGDAALIARDQLVLWSIRLPRIALAVMIGALLAAGGTVMQGLFRNPLADPALVGISPRRAASPPRSPS